MVTDFWVRDLGFWFWNFGSHVAFGLIFGFLDFGIWHLDLRAQFLSLLFSRLSSFDINVWGDAELNILGDELDEEFLLLIGEPFLEHSAENMTEPAVPKIPEFHGTPEENLSAWVETLDSIFEIAPKEENQRYKYARAHIRNAALALLTGFVGDKWSELKAHLLKLDPHGNQLAATAALFDLQQGGSSLDVYYKACAARFGRIKPPMAKEEQLRWYLRGLDPALRGYLPAVDLSGTLADAQAVLLTKTSGVGPSSVASVDLDAVQGPRPGGQRPSGQRLAADQLEALRVAGLCFKCFKKYSPGHRCGKFSFPSPPSLSSFAGKGLFLVPGWLEGRGVQCLIDSGASENFVREGLLTKGVRWTESVTLANGASQACSAPVKAELRLLGSCEQHEFLVTRTRFDVILGLPWLAKAKPEVDWENRKLVLPGNVRPLSRMAEPRERVQLDRASMNSMLSELGDGDETLLMTVQAAGAIPGPHSPEVAALLTEFADVFPDKLPMELPPDRGNSFKIILQPGTRAQVRPMKRFSPQDMESLVGEVESLLKAGFIKPSESEFGAQVLFVNKKDGTRRMCIDYRSLNADTVRDVYPLPLIDEIFDRLAGARVFSKLDLRSGYHQMRVNPEDTHKTAFRTPFGNYEFLVLPFGLTNAPSAFSRMIAKVFPVAEFRKFLAPYVDDLLLFSRNTKEHLVHLRQVFQKLRDNKLFVKPSKCILAVPEVEYLGFIVSADGVRSDPAKVAPIVEMAPPKNASEVKSFLGMIAFFSRFIADHARLSLVLTDLTKKGVPFVWTEDHQRAFEELKMALTKTPVLQAFDPTLETVVQTDASDRAVGAVLLQRPSSGALRPVAFLSRKLTPAESRYPVQEKEALAIVTAFKKWEHYLRGMQFKLETDHQSLVFIKTSKEPSRRLLHWIDFLAEFHYDPIYRRGAEHFTADALSRMVASLAAITGPAPDPEILNQIKNGYAADPYFEPVYRALVLGEVAPRKFRTRIGNFFAVDGVIFFRDFEGDRTCVPNLKELRHLLMRECHESVTAGHLGVMNTQFAVRRRYFWPKMESAVREWIKGCQVCQKTKPELRGTSGLYQPLEQPSAPWESVGVDFITGLPESGGYNSIMTVIDRFSGMAHFLPTTKSVTAEGAADLFTREIVRLHGLPRSIVSDRDPKFTSEFWEKLFQRLDVKLAMSTADHPQSNGQTERANGSITQMLRAYSSEKQDTWSKHLPMLEFAFNSAKSSATERSPFMTVFGRQPVAPADTYVPAPVAPVMLDKLPLLHRFVREARTAAQDAVALRENEARREFVAKPGDLVWLDTKQSRSSTVVADNNKMKDLYVGPFKVLEADGNTAKLDLPAHMGIHPRVNASKLKMYVPPVIPMEEPEAEPDGSYEVERILKTRRVHRRRGFVSSTWCGGRDTTQDMMNGWTPPSWARLESWSRTLRTPRHSLREGGKVLCVCFVLFEFDASFSFTLPFPLTLSP